MLTVIGLDVAISDIGGGPPYNQLVNTFRVHHGKEQSRRATITPPQHGELTVGQALPYNIK